MGKSTARALFITLSYSYRSYRAPSVLLTSRRLSVHQVSFDQLKDSLWSSMPRGHSTNYTVDLNPYSGRLYCTCRPLFYTTLPLIAKPVPNKQKQRPTPCQVCFRLCVFNKCSPHAPLSPGRRGGATARAGRPRLVQTQCWCPQGRRLRCPCGVRGLQFFSSVLSNSAMLGPSHPTQRHGVRR